MHSRYEWQLQIVGRCHFGSPLRRSERVIWNYNSYGFWSACKMLTTNSNRSRPRDETIDWPRFENIHCLATLYWETRWRNVKRGREGLPNLTMARATDIWEHWKASLSQQRLLSGERLISPRAHYPRLFIWRTIPAQIWRRRLREINKSSARRLLHECVCVWQRMVAAPMEKRCTISEHFLVN